MSKLAALVFVGLVVVSIALSAEQSPELLSAKDLWSLIEDTPDSMHDEVLVIKRYLDEMDAFAFGKIKNPSKEQLALLAGLAAKENLTKFREEAKELLDAYKDDPEENPAGRKADLQCLELCIKRLGEMIMRAEKVEAVRALQAPVAQAVEKPAQAPLTNDMLRALVDRSLVSVHGEVQIIKRYVDQVEAFRKVEKPSQEHQAVLADLMARNNLSKVLGFAQQLLDDHRNNPEMNPDTRKIDIESLDLCVTRLTALMEQAGPARQPEFRAVTDKEAEELDAFLKRLKEMIEKQQYLQIAKTELLIDPPAPPGKLPRVAEKLAGNAKGYIKLIDSLLAKKQNWLAYDNGAVLIQAKSDWSEMGYRSIKCVRNKEGKWLCQTISPYLPENMEGVDVK